MPRKKKAKCTVEERVLVYPRGVFQPQDWLSFIQLPLFEKRWAKLGLTDDDLRDLEMALMAGPTAGAVVPGTGGLRKLRCSPSSSNKGKSGSLRVCYVYFEDLFIVILVTVYSKSEAEDLTENEKAAIKAILPKLRQEFSRERAREGGKSTRGD